jgi:acyl-CoA synthetase (NDP forming)
VASIGNKLNVDEVDLLEYYLADSQTELVFLYLESFSRPRKFLELAASSSKPIVLQKSNTSPLSQGVAKSHTNAVTGNDAVTDFALEQAGVIRVRDIHDTMNCIKAALLPPMKGNRLAVLSPGGGTAVMGADEAHRHDFELPDLPESFLTWLKAKGRAGIINLTNPLDLGDIYDIDIYIEAIEHLLGLSEIDGVFMDMAYSSEWAESVSFAKFFDFCNKNIMGSEKPVFLRANVAHPHGLQEFNAALTVPYFESMPGAFCAIRKVMDVRNMIPLDPKTDSRPQNHNDIKKYLGDAQKSGKKHLLLEGFEILRAMATSIPSYCFIPKEKARSVGGIKFDFPVALKVLGDQFIHKTDTGGVSLGITDHSALTEAIGSMLADNRLADSSGFLIQEMVETGTEMIVGAKRDPQFGPVVVVGAGGILVELLADVCAAPAPVSPEMANRMTASLKSHDLLTGYRGKAPADVASLVDIIVKVSHLMATFPEIEEIDLNPVMVMDDGLGSVVVDCKMFISMPFPKGSRKK